MTEIATATASSPTPSGQCDPNTAAFDAEMHARVEQDASEILAAIQPRTWTFTSRVTGQKETFTCMPGCDIDHAKDVETPTAPEDICCITWGESIELPVLGSLCNGSGAEEFCVLSWQIDMHPFSVKMGQRLPHVNIEVLDDQWIEDLDPDALVTVIGQLQKQVDSLRSAHAQLVTVRTKCIAEQARIDDHVDQILDALREVPQEATA